MRLPTPRFTVRFMMVAVGFVAVAAWAAGIVREESARAHRQPCRYALWTIALALRSYHDTAGAFPPGTLCSEGLPPERRLSWVPLILNWTDHYQNMMFLFDRNSSWDSQENLYPRILDTDNNTTVPSTQPLWFPIQCRGSRVQLKPGLPDRLDYVGIAGLGTDAPTLPGGHPRAGVFGYDRQTSMSDIKDGASNTMLLAETTIANGPWTAGGPASVRGLDPRRQPYIGRGRQFGGNHPGGAMVAFADGSVRFLRESIDPGVFEALSTVAGGEALPARWDR